MNNTHEENMAEIRSLLVALLTRERLYASYNGMNNIVADPAVRAIALEWLQKSSESEKELLDLIESLIE